MLTFSSSSSPIVYHSKENEDLENPLELSSPTSRGNSSILSMVTNQFVSEASNIPRRLYCPFCLYDFGFDFLLKTHIRELHVQEIKNFSRVKLDAFTLDHCSYCHAKFYVRGLLPKHIIRKHQQCILGTVSIMKPDFIVQCKFCPYQASMKQLKLLFIHLENKHLNDVITLLSAYNLSINNAVNALANIEVLREEIQNLAIEKPLEQNENPKPILKRGSLYNNLEVMNALDQDNTSRTRRKLRFDLPDLSLTSESSDKENVSMRQVRRIFELGTKKPKPSKLITPNKVKPEPSRTILQDITYLASEGPATSEPRFQSYEVLPFKCGICRQVFRNNAQLLSHVKQSHNKLHLQPRYRCGWCKARFFKNSYLVKHHEMHTRPKCLSNHL